MSKNGKDKLCLYIRVRTPAESGHFNDSGYYHVDVRVGVFAGPKMDEHASQSPRSGASFVRPDEAAGLYIRGLELAFQGDRESAGMYLGEVQYRIEGSHIRARELGKMYATMKKIEAKIRKMDLQYGAPADPAERVARFAQAVGTSTCFARYKDQHGHLNDADDDRCSDVPSIRNMANRVISNAIQRFGKKAA